MQKTGCSLELRNVYCEFLGKAFADAEQKRTISLAQNSALSCEVHRTGAASLQSRGLRGQCQHLRVGTGKHMVPVTSASMRTSSGSSCTIWPQPNCPISWALLSQAALVYFCSAWLTINFFSVGVLSQVSHLPQVTGFSMVLPTSARES